MESNPMNAPLDTATTIPSSPVAPDSDRSPEALLVARVRSNDQRACEEFVRTYGTRMLALARRFFGDDSDVQDAVQDAFLSAFGAIGRFEGQSALGTWLHRITVNACLM